MSMIRTLGNVIPAYTAKFLLDMMADTDTGIVYVGACKQDLDSIQSALDFFNTHKVPVVPFYGWDCTPYDRVGPSAHISASRLKTLAELVSSRTQKRLVLTTADAITQRVIPRHILRGRTLSAKVGDTLRLQDLHMFLVNNGFRATTTVREAGEFATRGGMVDMFPSTTKHPIRLDFFGEELESIRAFDVMSQKSLHTLEHLILYPVNEVLLTDDTIHRFQGGYKTVFGVDATQDTLYDSITRAVPYQGYEHWQPLFYDTMETLFDYIPVATPVVYGHDVSGALYNRMQDISEYYSHRLHQKLYRPIPVDMLYLDNDTYHRCMQNRSLTTLSCSAVPHGENLPIRASINFTSHRVQGDDVWQAVKDYTLKSDKPIIIACNTMGEMERIRAILRDFGLSPLDVAGYDDIAKIQHIGVAVLSMRAGYEANDYIMVSQHDILGEKTLKNTRRAKSKNFITDYSTMEVGDLVVHASAGIGRYEGLETLDIHSALHDCLRIAFDGNDTIFVPVENIDVLSRYGDYSNSVQLDRLGHGAWNARKQKLQERIGEMADALIQVASARALRAGDVYPIPTGMYDEFCEQFPYILTDDQAHAIEDVLQDLNRGTPMDRLICGDVGFGKTEVAMRGIFCAVANGAQVAIVAPTTLLVRQHFETLCNRFKNFPFHIAKLSRLSSPKNNADVKKRMRDGRVDIVVGTHGLFAHSVEFKNLGLVVIDEEQSFGVAQKESLKKIKDSVHMVSLSATPIPRTLQTALSGVRDMSIIATPPIDRLAIRTFNMPYDSLIIKEALMRERWRGGQSYYVCPRVSDLEQVYKDVSALVPDLRIAVVHGGVSPKELDTFMNDFVNGTYDVLIATNIIESGIDVKTANTMIIHRAEMFGMSQLYQLRGRIGRSKIQAYCYLSVPVHKKLSENAKKRLHVISSLDTLGCGFNIASHDLDIRGAGNVLGAEQSGHVREVGVELYQRMLEDAILARKQQGENQTLDTFSPQISLGMAIYIPDDYIPDLSERLAFYRRLGSVTTREQCDDIVMEMGDRFGKIPDSVHNLLKIVHLKILCTMAHVEHVDAGDKGAVIGFYKNACPYPEKIITYISDNFGTVKLRPDSKLVITKAWKSMDKRISGTERILQDLANMAQ